MSIMSEISNKIKARVKPDKNKVAENQSVILSESAVYDALKNVIDPDLHKDIVALGFVKKVKIQASQVAVEVQLTSPACPVKEELKKQCEDFIRRIPGVLEVKVDLTFPKNRNNPQSGQKINNGLVRVNNIIAVASGKGGVGKSTTAMNLARSLAHSSAKVGVIDADIYGPSIPTLSKVGKPTRMEGSLIVPPEVDGIKLISVSMFSENNKAHILRGPMAANLVKQFLSGVAWGELDYLLIDYPPGTGDIQLTISQIAALTGAVIVTTPQDLALIDVKKAISMFDTMKVPVVGLIENMSYFLCDSCSKKHHIFKTGGGKKLAQSLGLPLLGEIPIEPHIVKASDEGFGFGENNLSLQQPYKEVTERFVRELAILNSNLGASLGSFSLTWK